MRNIVIEKNIPMPESNRNRYKRGVSTWDCLKELEIGDSFLAKKNDGGAIYSYAKKFGIKIAARTVDKESARYFRIAPTQDSSAQSDPAPSPAYI